MQSRPINLGLQLADLILQTMLVVHLLITVQIIIIIIICVGPLKEHLTGKKIHYQSRNYVKISALIS